jgi:hypothetical protein
MSSRIASVFFCVRSGEPTQGIAAMWRPFLLGPTVVGQRVVGP